MGKATPLDYALDRKAIDRAGLEAIYISMFGPVHEGLTVPDLKHRIKTFGQCQCDNKRCREPLAGKCDFDHMIARATSEKAATVIWKAITRTCHLLKTNGPKGDNANTRKVKRIIGGHTQADKRDKPSFQSAGFQKAPEGHSQWPSRKMKQPYRDNAKQLDDDYGT